MKYLFDNNRIKHVDGTVTVKKTIRKVRIEFENLFQFILNIIKYI